MGSIDLPVLLIQYAVFLFALTFHEWAHAWAGMRLGDTTAADLGRLTLHPAPHIDPIGTVVFPLLGFAFGGFIFGWAKPVPINIFRLRRPSRDVALIAAAGPAANLLLVVLSVVAFHVVIRMGGALPSNVMEPLVLAIVFSAVINLILMIFNLIPVPPLDGSKVLQHVGGEGARNAMEQIAPYGMMIVLLAMFAGFFQLIFGPFFALLRATGMPV